MQRYIAFILTIIPITISMLGIKLIRDFFFLKLHNPIPTITIQLLIGLFLLFIGLYLIGNFILFRDKKRNKVQSRFK